MPRLRHVGVVRRDGGTGGIAEHPRTLSAAGTGGEAPRPLREVAARPAPRLSVGIAEVDRVLGGGLVPGALVLLGGEPGIGKSTLVLEIAAGVARCVPTGKQAGGMRHRCPVCLRGGVRGPAAPPRRSPGLDLGCRRGPHPGARGDGSRCGAGRCGTPRAGTAGGGFGPDPDRGRAGGSRRLRRSGARVGRAAGSLVARARHARDPGRSRDQGRQPRRAAHPGAPGGRGPGRSRGTGTAHCGCSGAPRTASDRPRRPASWR